MRHQPAIYDDRGRRISRISINLSAHPEIREAVERDAIRWKSNLSWVAVTALAAFYDIDIVRADEPKKKSKKRKNRKRRG